MATGQRNDPYGGYNFLVEIDGITRAGFQECSGLDSSQDAGEYREGSDGPTTRKLPAGMVSYSNLSLKWGITVEKELWEWRTVEHPRLIRQIPFFEYGGETLWGLTGLLTLDLLDRCIEPGSFLTHERREFRTSWEEKQGPRDCVE